MLPWFSLFVSFYSAWLFFNGSFLTAAILFQLSVALDFVDGYVARIKKNGSLPGILFDGYSDIMRVMFNVGALAWYFRDDSTILLLLLAFTGFHFAESFLDFEFIFAEKWLRRDPPASLSRVEEAVIRFKSRLERVGLKTIFIHYQERLFIVLALGPMTGQFAACTIAGIAAVLFSMHFKLILDTALLKNRIIHQAEEYMRG